MSIEARIPGVKAQHAIITDNCRRMRSGIGAFEEACERLRQYYEVCLKTNSGTEGVNYHVVLVVEHPWHRQQKEVKA